MQEKMGKLNPLTSIPLSLLSKAVVRLPAKIIKS